MIRPTKTTRSRSWPRDGLTPEDFQPLLKGTKLLTLADDKKVFVKGPGLDSLYGSSKVADDFNVTNEVYKEHQDVDSYIDPSFIDAKKPMASSTP